MLFWLGTVVFVLKLVPFAWHLLASAVLHMAWTGQAGCRVWWAAPRRALLSGDHSIAARQTWQG